MILYCIQNLPTFQLPIRSHGLPMEAPVIVVEPGLYLGFFVRTAGIWSNPGDGMCLKVVGLRLNFVFLVGTQNIPIFTFSGNLQFRNINTYAKHC